MAKMFNRFEIQSELSKSDTAMIYKAIDTESNQIVALKTQNLEPLGDGANAFVETLLAEGEQTRDLQSQNIVALYGAGEIDGQFCAAMEYIQGNSVATMLARKEGFSIWDLLDITRQVCSGLEQAAAKGVAHSSLEPAKIMVQWDGMVKILGYGISNMSLIDAQSGKGLGRLMPYCSPEQIRGEAVDLRSNLFTVGTILYEMVVGRKAFQGTDPRTLLAQIENEMPPNPTSLNPKIQPAVSALIMRAVAKDPAARYQHARELLEDLEKCKENNKKGSSDTKKTNAPSTVVVDPAVRAIAASKFVSGGASQTEASGASPTTSIGTKAVAAAAGATSGSTATRTNTNSNSGSNSGARTISEFDVSAPSVGRESTQHSPLMATDPMMSGPAVSRPATSMSSAAPSTPVASGQLMTDQLMTDPMMSDPLMSAAGASKSFSDLAEMPPLKEPVFVPPPPEPIELSRPTTQIYPKKETKPRVQPREVAGKAIKEISTVPPRLMLYSILGAVALILVVAVLVFLHVRSQDDESTAAPRAVRAVASNPNPQVSQNQPETTGEKASRADAPAADAQPGLVVHPVEKRASKNSRRFIAAAAVPVALPGQALIDSTPPGAQIQIDGRSDSAWVTPINLSGLTPGRHIISANKTGYTAEIRSLDVAAGSKSSLSFHLSPMNALVMVNSTPPGAAIMVDGRPVGRVTPAQFSLEKGPHTVLLRKAGYLDETVTADIAPGQNFQVAPVLRALGNAEDMRTVGKLNKLFGHGGDSTAGMGAISVRTQPKGAQVVINQRVLDKMSPVDVMVGPGNYVVDVTMTGFKPIHKVVTVDKGSKAAIDETLERQ